MCRQENKEPGQCALRLRSRMVGTAEGGQPRPEDKRYEHSLDADGFRKFWHSMTSGKMKRTGKKAGRSARPPQAGGLKMESLKLKLELSQQLWLLLSQYQAQDAFLCLSFPTYKTKVSREC